MQGFLYSNSWHCSLGMPSPLVLDVRAHAPWYARTVTHRLHSWITLTTIPTPLIVGVMAASEDINGIEPVKNGFQSFEHAAADIVLAASFNPSGTRAVLCSADHKIRVYNIDGNDAWTLADVWRGHDAEVLDASVFQPLLWECLLK